MTHPPTSEQQAALDVAGTGGNLVIEALAGTGKTSTLEMISRDNPDRRFAYVAFNKAIVTEATGRFPSNVTASTAHSLAFRQVGRNYAHRLGGGRLKSFEIARLLRVQAWQCETPAGRKVLQPGFLASHALKAVRQFCLTADPEPTTAHVPTVPGLDPPLVDADGKTVSRRGPNMRQLALFLEPVMKRAWDDLCNINGTLPFQHNDYLKMWQLSGPRIHADVIMYDEAQDANPCMLDIVNSQFDAQLVFVGDTYQQIYAWNGAINALASADPDAPRTRLTESFRFGPAVADIANMALAHLDCPVTLTGRGGPSTIETLPKADAILFRTNAKAFATALQELRIGTRVAIVGGANAAVDFARSAQSLKEGGRAWHPDLACFDTWGEVQDYVEHDPAGDDLKQFVDLCDEYGPDVLIAELQRCTDEARADLILSTAHKSKGREWDDVALAGDYPDPEQRDLSDEDVRLLYVAATRAKRRLDIGAVAFYNPKGES